jgi:hypothetical protein
MHLRLISKTALLIGLCLPLTAACTIRTGGADDAADENDDADDDLIDDADDDSANDEDDGASETEATDTESADDSSSEETTGTESTGETGETDDDDATSDSTDDSSSADAGVEDSGTVTSDAGEDETDAGTDAGSDVDAAPPRPEIDEVDSIGVGVSGDQFCSDGTFTITVQPKDAEGNLIEPLPEELSCTARAGEAEVDCSIEGVTCDPGGDAASERTVVLVIVDDSGSMDDNDPDGLRKEACTSFVDQLGPTDVVAITDFGNGGTSPASALQTVQGLTEDKALARAACESLVSGPTGTPIYGSVVDAANVFFPAAKEQFGDKVNFSVLMLSDGEPDSDTSDRDTALAAIADAKFPIYTVGLGPAAEGFDGSNPTAITTLQELSQNSRGAYASSVAPEGLGGLFEQIGSVVREGSCTVSAALHADAFASGDLVEGQLNFSNGDVSTDFSFNVPLSELEASRCQ